MKFKDLQPGDYVWIMDLEDEVYIESPPKRFMVAEELHTSEYGYQAISFTALKWDILNPYELRIDHPESSLTLDDPYWIGATNEEELLEVFNNPEKYGFELNI